MSQMLRSWIRESTDRGGSLNRAAMSNTPARRSPLCAALRPVLRGCRPPHAATEEDSLSRLITRDQDHECEGFGPSTVCVRVVGVADLPTRVGKFRIVAFWN